MSTAIDRGVFKGEAQGARALPPIHRVNMYFFFFTLEIPNSIITKKYYLKI